jgi:hypothetical protein
MALAAVADKTCFYAFAYMVEPWRMRTTVSTPVMPEISEDTTDLSRAPSLKNPFDFDSRHSARSTLPDT